MHEIRCDRCAWSKQLSGFDRTNIVKAAEEHVYDSSGPHETFEVWKKVDSVRSVMPPQPTRHTFLDSEDRVGG